MLHNICPIKKTNKGRWLKVTEADLHDFLAFTTVWIYLPCLKHAPPFLSTWRYPFPFITLPTHFLLFHSSIEGFAMMTSLTQLMSHDDLIHSCASNGPMRSWKMVCKSEKYRPVLIRLSMNEHGWSNKPTWKIWRQKTVSSWYNWNSMLRLL